MPGFALLPAAITMVAGPQIISAVVLATSGDAKRNSLAYIAGVIAAVLLGMAIALGLLQVFSGIGAGGSGGMPAWLTWLLVALLAFVAVKTFRDRGTTAPPKWLTGLQNARPRAASRLGFLLFLLMPTDIAMVWSASAYLKKYDLGLIDGLPFIVLTLLLISLPLLALLLLGDRADETLPAVRDWMNRYSWAINVGICVYFMYSLLK